MIQKRMLQVEIDLPHKIGGGGQLFQNDVCKLLHSVSKEMSSSVEQFTGREVEEIVPLGYLRARWPISFLCIEQSAG